MKRTRQYGFTLAEVLIVISVLAMVLTVVIGLAIQTSRIYALTERRIEPLNNLALAMKKMEPDFRNAMIVETDASNGRAIELVQPLKDADGFNAVQVSPSNPKAFTLVSGTIISYFLATRTYPNPDNPKVWIATPDAVNGNTLVRIVGQIAPSTSYLNGPNVKAIATGLKKGGAIFDYSVDNAYLLNADGTQSAGDETPADLQKVVRVGLTIPVRLVYPDSPKTVYQTLWTQFCIRNLPVP